MLNISTRMCMLDPSTFSNIWPISGLGLVRTLEFYSNYFKAIWTDSIFFDFPGFCVERAPD